MSQSNLLSLIDEEIARLQKVRSLLAVSNQAGRSMAVKGAATNSRSAGTKAGPKRGSKRTLSAEARARIAEAQRKRWAAHKKQAQGK